MMKVGISKLKGHKLPSPGKKSFPERFVKPIEFFKLLDLLLIEALAEFLSGDFSSYLAATLMLLFGDKLLDRSPRDQLNHEKIGENHSQERGYKKQNASQDIWSHVPSPS
jgi:hypothetical protein